MSEYKKENLIAIPKTQVNPGDLAVSINGDVFICCRPMLFYKCASVDTVNKTWSGFRAVRKGGAYSFEGAATEGLTYGNGFTPAVDGIYDAEALVYANRLFMGRAALTEGLVYHFPLQTDGMSVDGKYNFDPNNVLEYGVRNGVICAESNAGYDAAIKGAEGVGIGNDQSATIALWMYGGYEYGNPRFGINHNWGGDSPGQHRMTVGRDGKQAYFTFGTYHEGVKYTGVDILSDAKWHHLALVWMNAQDGYAMYIDGECVMSGTIEGEGGSVMASDTEIHFAFTSGGCAADARIYNRALAPEEVALLAANMP